MRPAPPGFDSVVWAELERARAQRESGDVPAALATYQAAWDVATAQGDHFHAMVIAHMAGAAEPDAENKHRWNVAAIAEAEAIPDLVRGRGMYSSLYNNVGLSHSLRGERDEARRYFDQALSHLNEVPQPGQGQLRAAIERNIARLSSS